VIMGADIRGSAG